MADLMEKLVEVLGSQELADKVSPVLGEFMIPKAEYKKVNDKYKEVVSERDKERAEKMTVEERIVAKEKELNDKIRGYSLKENQMKVEQILSGSGLSREEFEPLLESLVSDDAEVSSQRATKLVDTFKRQRELVEKTTKEALLKDTKSPEGGNPANPNKPTKFPTVI